MAVAACRLRSTPVVAETPEHKQGHNLLMKTEQRRKRMKLGPMDAVIAESPMKFTTDPAIPSSLPMSQFMRNSSFYSEKPSRNVSKYAKLEERMTQKVSSPPSQKFDSMYVAGSWLTSPRRITPKALFSSLLSPSPSEKAGTNLPRKLNLKSPNRNVGSCASLDFRSPTKTVGSSISTASFTSPPRSVASGLSHPDLDSPSRNTRSHTYSLQYETVLTQQPESLASACSLGMESDKRSPIKKRLSVKEAPTFTATLGSSSNSALPSNQSTEKAEATYDSNCRGTLMSVAVKTDPHLAENRASHKRKKSCDDDRKSATRKRPQRRLHLDSQSFPDEQSLRIDCDTERSEEPTLFTTLSFGCDVELDDAATITIVNKNKKVNSDALRHLGSSGIESESSSNDVDMMITRKKLLGRKCSSGFQSLGHISETECCASSPVFPTISNETAVGPSAATNQHVASDTVSASPVFGKRQMQSLAGESPCVSLSGSSRKRTPVPGCAESFSPDVSQHSIAHLMTSPLLDGSETLQKTGRNRPSTRRCLDQQMFQSGKRLSVSRCSSSKPTDEDN